VTNLNARLLALERFKNTAPPLTLQIDTTPTPEQQAVINHCIRTGRRLVAFFMPDDSAWMPGYGVPPWEVDHGNA